MRFGQDNDEQTVYLHKKVTVLVSLTGGRTFMTLAGSSEVPLPLSPPVPQTLYRNPNPPLTQVIAYGEEVGDSLAIAAESWPLQAGETV